MSYVISVPPVLKMTFDFSFLQCLLWHCSLWFWSNHTYFACSTCFSLLNSLNLWSRVSERHLVIYLICWWQQSVDPHRNLYWNRIRNNEVKIELFFFFFKQLAVMHKYLRDRVLLTVTLQYYHVYIIMFIQREETAERFSPSQSVTECSIAKVWNKRVWHCSCSNFPVSRVLRNGFMTSKQKQFCCQEQEVL